MPLERKGRSLAASPIAFPLLASPARLVGLALAASGLLVACGADGGSPERPEPEAQAKRGTTPSPAPTKGPRRPPADVTLTFEGVQARLTAEGSEAVINSVAWAEPRAGQSARASAELPPLPRGGEGPFLRYVLEDLKVVGEGCAAGEPRVEVALVTVKGFERVARRAWNQGEALDVETATHTYRLELEVKEAPACKALTFSLVARALR